jgi:hypothetical protein
MNLYFLKFRSRIGLYPLHELSSKSLDGENILNQIKEFYPPVEIPV